MRHLTLLISLLCAAWAGAALADPCEAIPQDGPMPAYLSFGATFSGPVARVLDGDSFCVAVGPTPRDWVEVRLADFYAPESGEAAGRAAKAALERIALGRTAVCVASMRTYDRVAARCQIDGRAVGDQMRDARIAEGGRGTNSRAHNASAGIAGSLAPRAQPAAGGFMYRSCAEARAAGAAPVRRGQRGYNPNLDGDNDGLACEPLRGH